ncbi:DUF4145 domain-containing protein [Staphylococcus nepalensis]|uniref:DUF4145 domain-containing protein n=1 Tax=Staphylococcus nepalensis TaxID=214473 RepID=UPI000DFA4B9A|nr:DUF4145 domain-containing protein [Staphylococcus nepalensis]SUM69839.1 Uncharacterised protein [Staphylococcus nepalensis]SUM96072.1 Uncharacterised protein [Staphylococcus nepalensis]
MLELIATFDESIYGPSKSGIVKLNPKCQYCNVAIHPEILTTTPINSGFSSSDITASIVYSCPQCQNHNFQTYKLDVVDYKECTTEPITKSFFSESTFEYPNEIDEISTSFKEIVNQSSQAENSHLNHLAGIGYRKAIEFLVKDYLIYVKPEETNSIKTKFLSQCIKMIDDEDIKNLAKAATWIGNDETHYTRLHKDKDISDMKRFIYALTHLFALKITIQNSTDFIDSHTRK